MNLEGKAAIITGGGTGVGRAAAMLLAEQGCAVLVNYSRSREGAEETAAECEKRGVKALAYRADGQKQRARELLADLRARGGGREDVRAQVDEALATL